MNRKNSSRWSRLNFRSYPSLSYFLPELGLADTDHTSTLNQLLECAMEYILPLRILFVDYEEAFDSAQLNAMLRAFVEEGIDEK